MQTKPTKGQPYSNTFQEVEVYVCLYLPILSCSVEGGNRNNFTKINCFAMCLLAFRELTLPQNTALDHEGLMASRNLYFSTRQTSSRSSLDSSAPSILPFESQAIHLNFYQFKL